MKRLMAIAALVLVFTAPNAAADISQPRQPARGPGGSETIFGGVRVTTGGNGNNAWELMEPSAPAPRSAPLVVVMHGYYEFSGYSVNDAIARHTALKGNVVIYPRWQTSIASPCPGPFDINPCVTTSATAIKAAIAYLVARPDRVQPRLGQTSYFGFSFGGIITANMLNRFKALGLPAPRAVFLDDPHDGGLTGNDEPALDSSLAGIPAATKFVCHAGADGVISRPPFENASCNAVFPKLSRIPAANKSLVLTSDDSHGNPPLQAIHGVCAGRGTPDTTPHSGRFPVDAYDSRFCWRSFDALRACGLHDVDCQYALGDSPQNRYIGTWSDGTPVTGLKVRQVAPISGTPVPPREAAPPPDPGRAPSTTVATVRVRRGVKRPRIHGTAAAEDGVEFVQVAVVRRAGAACRQLSAAGRWGSGRRCGPPTQFLWADGASQWSLTLPVRLPYGSYRVYARAIDSFGQTRATYGDGGQRTFVVKR